jgi:hypothetical protein
VPGIRGKGSSFMLPLLHRSPFNVRYSRSTLEEGSSASSSHGVPHHSYCVKVSINAIKYITRRSGTWKPFQIARDQGGFEGSYCCLDRFGAAVFTVQFQHADSRFNSACAISTASRAVPGNQPTLRRSCSELPREKSEKAKSRKVSV